MIEAVVAFCTVGYGWVRLGTVRYGRVRSGTVGYGRVRSGTGARVRAGFGGGRCQWCQRSSVSRGQARLDPTHLLFGRLEDLASVRAEREVLAHEYHAQYAAHNGESGVVGHASLESGGGGRIVM